jgi:glycogen(starch) synthase
LPWASPKLVVCHSCVLSWWRAVRKESAPESVWGRYRKNVSCGLRAADHVVAPSRTMLSTVIGLYGPLGCPVDVVLNGREPSLFCQVRKELYVFSSGRLWDEAKNIAALEHVASTIKWPVYVAGDSSEAWAGHSSPPGERTYRSLGFISSPEIAKWLSAASIFCLPARYEPFGLSALEAGLSGCALVLGDIASLREIWAGAAVFVDPEDYQQLTNTIQQLIANSVYREKCARRARLRALELTSTRMADRYLQIYSSMLARRNESQGSAMEASACA